MAYSGEITDALIAKLLADTGGGGLMTLMTDGVYYDVAGKGKTKSVIVKLMTHEVSRMFQWRGYEAAVYLVKAVALASSGANVKTAAARIDTLLENGTLTVPGYGLMDMALEEHVRYVEIDPANADARWQHEGGMYAVMVSPS